jgi:hypothetical protein
MLKKTDTGSTGLKSKQTEAILCIVKRFSYNEMTVNTTLFLQRVSLFAAVHYRRSLFMR